MKLRLLDKLIDRAYARIDEIETYSRCQHFSFVVRKNNVLSEGINNARKTHPDILRFGSKYFRIHSEFEAIRRFPLPPRELEKCILVNVRIGNDGKLRISRPCRTCQKMLEYFSVYNIYYTNDFGKFEKLV
jgi:hypothetical protein